MATRKYTVVTFKINSTVNPHLFVVDTMKEKNWEFKIVTDLPDGDILITVVLSQAIEASAQIKTSDVSNINSQFRCSESAKNQITFKYFNNYDGDIILYWKKEQSVLVLDCFKANKIRPKLKDVTPSLYSAKISKLAFEKLSLSQKYLLKDIRDKR